MSALEVLKKMNFFWSLKLLSRFHVKRPKNWYDLALCSIEFYVRQRYSHLRKLNKKIIKGLNLKINQGEVHAIMGPNGSGKSTLANILSGKPGYDISGDLKYEGEDLTQISIEERAQKGMFLAFQYPTEIPGVNTNNFLRTSLNSVRKANGQKDIDAISFLKIVKETSNSIEENREKVIKNICNLIVNPFNTD
mgnify:CR=1 FL=1